MNSIQLHLQENYRIDISKSYVFNTSLAKKFQAGSLIKPSVPPCGYCKKKDLKQCFCKAFTTLIGRTSYFEIKELQSLKNDLLKVCHQLDDIDIYEWNCHTYKTNEDSKIIDEIKKVTKLEMYTGSEMVTGAWAKLYEILIQCDLINISSLNEINEINSFHLCEIPGGFVSATNHFIKSINESCKLNWKAVSLNPFYEGNDCDQTLVDDSFLRETSSHWLFGADDSGDLLKKENIENIWKETSRSENQWQASFITADGSISVQHDPSNQESITANLHLAELICCLGILKIGGSFVLKMFTLFENSSISILALISLLFSKVAVVKPMLSKAGNSEVYVLGLNFLGIRSTLLRSLIDLLDDDIIKNKSIFPKEWIPDEFIKEIIECNSLFVSWQIESIEKNLRLWREEIKKEELNEIEKNKNIRSIEFVRMFDIRPLLQDQLIVSKPLFPPKRSSGLIKREDSRKKVGRLLEDRDLFFKIRKNLDENRVENWKSGNIELISFSFKENNLSEKGFINIKPNFYQKNFHKTKISRNFTAFLDIKEKDFFNKFNSRSTKIFFSKLKNQTYLWNSSTQNHSWKFVFTKKLDPYRFSNSKFSNLALLSQVIKEFQCFPSSTMIIKNYSDYIMSSLYLEPNLEISSNLVHLLLCLNNTKSSYIEEIFTKNKIYMDIGVEGSSLPLNALIDSFNSKSFKVILKMNTKHYKHFKNSIYSKFNSSQEINFNDYTIPIFIDLSTQLNKTHSLRDCLVQNVRKVITNENSKCDLIHLDINGQYFFFREIIGAEIESKWLFISGLIVALNSIKLGGDLLIFMNTSLTRFTTGIIFLLTLAFDNLCFIHPSSISPFCLRQYLFCQNFLDSDQSVIRRFLQYLIEMMYSSSLDCIQAFDYLYLTEDFFYNWIKENNDLMLQNALDDLKDRVTKNHLESNFQWNGSSFFMKLNNFPNFNFIITKIYKNKKILNKELNPWDGTFLCT